MSRYDLCDAKDTAAYLAKLRRIRLQNAGWCINGEAHGKATHGPRCAWCKRVHRVGVDVAYRQATQDPGAAQPPTGYVMRIRPSRW